MPEVTDYAPGTFCWVELSTTDAAAAKRFYTDLFGWNVVDTPAGPDMTYTMLQVDGKDIGALYEMENERKSQGVPPNWLSYISVKSADDSAAAGEKLGGTITMAAFDVMEVGRMAILRDPTGAVIALWQPKNHIGARLVNEPGALCWNELATTDRKKAADFYTGLFGWSANEQQTGPMLYTIFSNGEKPAGGMYEITEDMSGMPSSWIVYFAVENCDSTAEKAASSGAKIIVPPTDIPNVGRFSMIQDPQGAVFAVIKLTAAAA